MGEEVIAVPAEWAARTGLDRAGFDARSAAALADPDRYWAGEIDRLAWGTRPTRMDESRFDADGFGVRWFGDGLLNVAENCLDRHLAERGEQVAILWEPDDPAEEPRRISYAQLHGEVCRFANVLKGLGVGTGDRVMIYLPMVPEAAVAMLACARIGAIHTVVFGGFSPGSIADRIGDCGPKLLVTADEGRRGGKRVPLKANVDEALANGGSVETVVVLRATGGEVGWVPGRDRWWHEAVAEASSDCPAVAVPAEHPLFILYTSGSTGKPKGVVHSSGGYLLWAALTHAECFGYRAPEVFWCAADVGWITGHTYIVYGALANGATTLMYEGLPNWPTRSRIWEVIDRHGVTSLFTAPTVLRALMREGDEPVRRTSRASLRILGSVGEPINPEAWRWYHGVVGDGRCPIVDMWWQTETGGGMIAPLPGTTPLKPGSATLPLPGVEPQIVDGDGRVLAGAAEGNLVVARSWPGQMTGVWGDPDRFFQTYFTTFPGKYTTGDGARRDGDGYYWITGRVDDVINVSGHRMGTAEVESALVLHPSVAEAAVVGMPHDIKGQGIYAYVTLKSGQEASDDLRKALRDHVRREIGPIATPDALQFASQLPKTRSGKIMRRILRKIAENELSALGDTSTLADPAVVDDLVANRVG